MDKKPAKQQPKQPRRISAQYLENAALYYLQRYASSAENLRRVLLRKVKRSSDFHKTDPEPFYPVIDDMILRYERSGLLNDKGFAEAKVASLRRQGQSRQAILAKLQAKGLTRADIEAALAQAAAEHAEDAEMTAALAFIRRKKIGRYAKAPAGDPKARQKELAAMGRAGFSYELARAALQHGNADDTD